MSKFKWDDQEDIKDEDNKAEVKSTISQPIKEKPSSDETVSIRVDYASEQKTSSKKLKQRSKAAKEITGEKGKGGRNKIAPYKNRSIGIPDEYRMYVDIRAGVETEGNVNAFFRFLIEEDAKNHPDDFNYAQKKQAEQEKKSKKSEE